MKRKVGVRRVVVHPFAWATSGSDGEVTFGHVWVRFQVLLAVTVPGGRGCPVGWLGAAAAVVTGAMGTRNMKFGSNRSGIRAAGASFRVIPAAVYRVLSYLSLPYPSLPCFRVCIDGETYLLGANLNPSRSKNRPPHLSKASRRASLRRTATVSRRIGP